MSHYNMWWSGLRWDICQDDRGCLRIAQRFIAGRTRRSPPVLLAGFAREQEEGGESVKPTVETVGYCRASLRDELIAELKRRCRWLKTYIMGGDITNAPIAWIL